MHIILGALGSILTILYMLDRLGIDLGGMNPFYWYRRRAFAKKYGADPIFSVEDPMHIASLLVIGAAKLEGDLTARQKETAQRLFESEFSLNEKEALQLFGSAAHLLAAPQLLDDQLTKLVARSGDRFSPEQSQSLLAMMEEVASADGGLSASQQEFIGRVRSDFPSAAKPEGTWA
ncbi:MAG: TerB family tellurite resistance protein [Woeseiaceae bacterium]|nr:TerB family tellurite resistance protein [Woeseiaceae bacterium]